MKIPKTVVVAATRATVLKRKIADLSIEFDACKEVIRAWGVEVFDEDKKDGEIVSSLEVPTDEGTLTVIFPKDSPAVIKGRRLEDLLGGDLRLNAIPLVMFQGWSIAKGFADSWNATEDPFWGEERKLISTVIEWKRATPRVEPAK